MFESKKKRLFPAIITIILLFLLDRGTKVAAQSRLLPGKDVWLIKGVLSLHYLENTGAAFSILTGKIWFFLLITIVISAAIIVIMHRIRPERRFAVLYMDLAVLLAGALGNLYDRLFQGYVIDFIYFALIDFPVFNVADIYVTCSVILLLILILFVYKNEDF